MSWFDEQIKYRKTSDNEALNASLEHIARAVMGEKLTDALDKETRAQSAVEEILKFYHYTPKKLTDLKPSDSLEYQMEYRLRPFGIMYRSVELDSGWYKQAVGAMIGTLANSGIAVALLPRAVSGYYFYDPETGKKVIINKRNENLLSTEAYCFYKPLPQKALTVVDLLQFMIKQLNIWDICIYVGTIGLASALGLVSPLLTKWLFGEVLESKNLTVLFALTAFMLCYSLSSVLFSVFQGIINSRVTVKQNVNVQAAVMNRIMSLPVTFFKKYSSGEMQQRSSYVQSLCTTLFTSVGTVGLTSAFSLIYLGQIFAFAPALVVPSLIITLVSFVVTLLTTFRHMRINRELMEIGAETVGMTHSIITGIQKIKLAGAEKRMFARWGNQYAKHANLEYNPPLLIKLNSTITLSISLIGTIVLYYLAVKNNISVSSYYAFNASFGVISGAFTAVADIATTFANIKPTLEMARPIMEAVPETADDKEIISSISGSIELTHVSFRYNEDMPWVIDDMSLQIKPGEYVGIVGTTGCGKSTLLRVLLGFETPQKGTVFYDRKDIKRIDLKSLRRKIGVVMQDGKLFWGDIYSNIVVSAPHLTLDDAWEAARIASIADDIEEMPMKMHTIISEGQGGISGGQRQRILIARAVAAKPKVLFFDEATSALDNLTQKNVAEAIDKLKCTRIVIAHRLSTIRHCDRIIVLDKGHIVGQGTYEELIDNNAFFADLVARQRVDTD